LIKIPPQTLSVITPKKAPHLFSLSPGVGNNGIKIAIAASQLKLALTVFPTEQTITGISATIGTNLTLGTIFYGNLSLAPGEYQYHPTTGVLILPLPLSYFSLSIPIVYLVINSSIATTSICNFYPSLFLQKWNVQGEMVVNRSFGGHPTLKLSFQVKSDRYNEVKTELAIGEVVEPLGSWRIEAKSVSIVSQSNLMTVELDLVGIHAPYADPSRNPVDKPYSLGSKKATSVSIGAIAAGAGVLYSGPYLSKKIRADTPSTEYTNLRQELESRAVIGGGFVYYDDPNSVQIRQFGAQTTHLIAESEIINIESETYNGAGATVGGEKLAEELRNCVLQLQFEGEENNNAQTGVVIRWEFENADSLFQCTLSAQPSLSGLVEPKSDILRTPSQNFDSGGYTKIARKYTELNGLQLSSEEWTYGFTYTSLDVHVVTGQKNNIVTFAEGSSPSSFWGEVKHIITNSIYDSEGYLIRVETTGTSLSRLKQESGTEAISLYAQALQAGYGGFNPPVEAQSLYNQAIAYTFTLVLPINEVTDYSLSSLRDYYADIIAPDPVSDPFWIEPRFCHQKLRTRTDFLSAPNPNSFSLLQLPPIVTGHWSSESEKIHIKSNAPERFNRKTVNKNQEGENGQNAIATSTSAESIGRPSTHTRLELLPPPPPPNNNYEKYKDYNCWLSTPNSGSNHITIEQTLSYPDVDNPFTGRKAAQTEYSIKNSRATRSIELKILYREGLSVGDSVIFRSIEWIIFAMHETYKLHRPISGEIKLTLGVYINCPVFLFKQKKIK
jgi:hypothetical protein